ncbi:MAG TPA: adenosylmethionine decarboxylase [Alphaproteobacteria bacterium]|nr:adenosylmethionine decarboxylase [Alphaproteobacteria bacterium]
MHLGNHLIIDFFGCKSFEFNSCRDLEKHMPALVKKAGGTVVQVTFHEFIPHGTSGVVVIAESHVTIHTWPEHETACVDVFSCGTKLNVSGLIEDLKNLLGAQTHLSKDFKRGEIGQVVTLPHKKAV